MKSTVIAMLMAVVVFGVSQAQAGLFTLTDGNSTAKFVTTTAEADSNQLPVGQYDWNVDGQTHLFQQWFWVRDNPTGAEIPLTDLPITAESTFDTNFDQDPDTLFVRYDVGEYKIEVSFRLQGGAAGSQWSDLAEQIKITNMTSQPLELSFFQYVDLDLNGEFDGDSVQILEGQIAQQQDTVSGVVANETVVTPKPTKVEASLWSENPALLDRLNDGDTDDLDNDGSLKVGDAVWAFQWDFNIPAGKSVQISKDKQLLPIPEPATMALLGLGGLVMMRRRKK